MQKSKPFTFGFDDDDIDGKEIEGLSQGIEQSPTQSELPGIVAPQLHSLYNLLSSLPSEISYSTSSIEYDTDAVLKLPRRELYDIRAQIMAEDETPSMEPKYGLTNDDDITPKIYEGGFKTWECSLDLAYHVAKQLKPLADGEGLPTGRFHMVELGAGSALPSLVVFSAVLLRSQSELRPPPIYLTLCDYNLSVLTHSTIPNLLLVWCACSMLLSESPEDEIEITSELTNRFVCDLADRNIRINAISGAWGPDFLDHVPRIHGEDNIEAATLVLASETIYALPTLIPFTETLVSILRTAEKRGGTACAMVAVKQVYFGVGGGVEDFLRELKKIGGQSEVVWEKEGVGVGRVILGVELRFGQAL